MADRIKGITIEIGGDTTKLSDSLKDVNKSIKDTKAELKDVDKLLKLDPKNLELLVQKQELLGKATEETKEKLEKLKDAQEQMKANGVDETSSQYRALTREIAETEQEMEKLKDASLETDKAIIQVASGADKIADATGRMAKKTSALSKASGVALTGLIGLGVKAANDADELSTLAKQTGISTEALQKMSYASDLIDVNVEDITGAIRKMKGSLVSGEAKFEEIGVHVKDVNGNLRDTETIFYETVRALGRIENETERDTKAMAIFGKSADELAGLLDDGGEAFRRLGDEAKANGAIISQEELDKANELNDTLDRLKKEMGTSFAQVGVSLAEAFKPVIESIVPMIKKLADFLKGLSPTTMKVVLVVLALVAALSPLLSLISSLATVIPLVTTAMTAVSLPMLGIVAAIALVIGAIALLIKFWDDIKAAAGKLVDTISEKWEQIKQKCSDLANKFLEIWNGIKEKFANIWNGMKETVSNVWNSITGFFSNGWQKIKNLFKSGLSFPKIKLPHFSITGKFSLLPPSVPKLGIKWYRKAYDDAYLLNSPTIFGAQGGNLLGGGEGNGSEAVVGTDKLMSMMSDVVGNQTANVTVVLEGDAQGVFKLVRTENTKFYKSNGYNPLMV